MPPPRRPLGTPVRAQHLDATPLPGYLCEQCQDAPAVQWQLTPDGGERGVCTTCLSGRDPDGVDNLTHTPVQPEPNLAYSRSLRSSSGEECALLIQLTHSVELP